jgi:hypothetical protein
VQIYAAMYLSKAALHCDGLQVGTSEEYGAKRRPLASCLTRPTYRLPVQPAFIPVAALRTSTPSRSRYQFIDPLRYERLGLPEHVRVNILLKHATHWCAVPSSGYEPANAESRVRRANH